jgi:hypothetical protein
MWPAAFTMGAVFSVANYASGWGGYALGQTKNKPKMYSKDGAIVTEGGLISPGSGLSLGPWINVATGVDQATLRHEMSHVRQYESMGGWNYLARTWQSPFINVGLMGGQLDAEAKADRRAWTNSYGHNYNNAYLYQTILFNAVYGRNPQGAENVLVWYGGMNYVDQYIYF